MIARLAAAVTAALGILTGLVLLFAPLGTRCTVSPSVPAGGQVASSAPMRCEATSMVEAQGLASMWPLPLLVLAVWSLAPLLAAAGVWTRRMSLVSAAMVIEATVLISFGAAPLYVPFVLVPLAITWVLARRTARPIGRSASPTG